MTNPSATMYELDPGSSKISFSVRHMMFSKVHGSFTRFKGTLLFDRENPEASQTEATLEVQSITTHESSRDDYLRTSEFFEASRYPTITFKSESFQKLKSGFEIKGMLMIRDASRKVTLKVDEFKETKDATGLSRLSTKASCAIKRKDFNLSWNAAIEAGGVLVGDDIEISLQLVFIAKK
jgi:polyisoprenoid-binding protein YceI